MAWFDDLNVGIEKFTSKFGGNHTSNSITSKNYTFRPYTSNRGYLALINPDQPLEQGYSGLSFVVFPLGFDKTTGNIICVVSIGIGTDNVGNDEELANLPYMRRAYGKLTKYPYFDASTIYLKNSFADIDSESVLLFQKIENIRDKYENAYDFSLASSIYVYKKYLPAAGIIELTKSDINLIANEDLKIENRNGILDFSVKRSLTPPSNGLKILLGWLAQYAIIREWNFNLRDTGRNYRKDCVKLVTKKINVDDKKEIVQLLASNKYIVVQGAPGVGKTYLSNEIANDFIKKNGIDNVFFTQFHAETTYSDFVGGIKPELNSNSLIYRYSEGVLTQCIRKALSTKNDVLLIVDEINRANLANVLGPIFYLFEKNYDNRIGKIALEVDKTKMGNGESFIELTNLPENLYVLATMNTADRSLAVVDFALRRRFMWYTLYPHEISNKNFQSEPFETISHMFEKYASDDELSLQPGQSYFLASNDKEFKDRMRYELMPLFKEYFNEGYLLKMQNEFSNYYTSLTEDFMYK